MQTAGVTVRPFAIRTGMSRRNSDELDLDEPTIVSTRRRINPRKIKRLAWMGSLLGAGALLLSGLAGGIKTGSILGNKAPAMESRQFRHEIPDGIQYFLLFETFKASLEWAHASETIAKEGLEKRFVNEENRLIQKSSLLTRKVEDLPTADDIKNKKSLETAPYSAKEYTTNPEKPLTIIIENIQKKVRGLQEHYIKLISSCQVYERARLEQEKQNQNLTSFTGELTNGVKVAPADGQPANNNEELKRVAGQVQDFIKASNQLAADIEEAKKMIEENGGFGMHVSNTFPWIFYQPKPMEDCTPCATAIADARENTQVDLLEASIRTWLTAEKPNLPQMILQHHEKFIIRYNAETVRRAQQAITHQTETSEAKLKAKTQLAAVKQFLDNATSADASEEQTRLLISLANNLTEAVNVENVDNEEDIKKETAALKRALEEVRQNPPDQNATNNAQPAATPKPTNPRPAGGRQPIRRAPQR